MKTLRILLVDDNTYLRKAFSLYFKNIQNIKIAGECADGSEVIPFLEKHNKIDLIFMDIIMKNVDGFEATLRVTSKFPNIKIIGFSTNDNIACVNKMKSCGADGFISKFDVTEKMIIDELKIVMS